LAEVLITLGIIGVVAALTIPQLITNYKKHQTVVQLKKAYTTMANLFQAAENEHGPISTWPETIYTTATCSGSDECAYTFAEKYLLKNLKHYEYKTRPDHVFPKGRCCVPGINSVDHLDAGNHSTKWFYLDDGTCFTLNVSTHYYWDYIFYDINGDKGPNIVGKDIFTFDFGKLNKFKLAFHPGSWGVTDRDAILETLCSKSEGGYYGGDGCGWVIQYDGWQIKDDYPW